MYRLTLIVFFCSLSCIRLNAQDRIPFIKAHSTAIRILDGDQMQDGGIVPDLKPDVYVYHNSGAPKKITYYTDLDSISFWVKPGQVYDFAVILNGKDTCYQRFTDKNPDRMTYHSSNSEKGLPDTIPIRLGANNAIHFRGSLNNSDTLDLIFDTGANKAVLTEEGREKGAVMKEGSNNGFSFAGITVQGTPIIFSNGHGSHKSDGVIGYNAFEDKVVEINYDLNIMVIHPSMPAIQAKGHYTGMVWRGPNLFIECELRIGNKLYKGLFLFDTGSRWSLSLNKKFAIDNELYGLLPVKGERKGTGVNGIAVKSDVVILPELSFAGLSLKNVPMDLEQKSSKYGVDKDILGNDVLKRFNLFLDYQNGKIYMTPNHLKDAPYNMIFNPMWLWIGGGFIIILLILFFIYYRRRKLKRDDAL